MPLALQRFGDRSRALDRRFGAWWSAVAAGVGALGARAGLFRCLPFSRRRQIDAGPTRLGQPDGDRLLGRSRAVLSFANVMHLLADEFTRLRRRRLAFALVLSCSFDGFFVWHVASSCLGRAARGGPG